MRMMMLSVAAAFLLAPAAYAQFGDDNPFPVARGSALPPPAEARGGAEPPPEGVGVGGIDFGRWRQAEAVAYGRQFQVQLRERFAARDEAQTRADLEANGFSCDLQEGRRLHCRLETAEGPCAFDWYAVVEQPGAPVIAGFDRICLPAP